jgi:transposase
MNDKTFRPYELDQSLLLPPNLHDWLPEGDLAYFILAVVEKLDLSAVYEKYEGGKGGYPPYDPRMMTALLLYAYCQGVSSSRKIERATIESVPYRVITGNQQPDHDTISEFRRTHRSALAALFLQVLEMCQEAGLVTLAHVSLDGTKVRANASKHKAMSYGRMKKKRKQLRKEIREFLDKADIVDANEDARYGKGKRGDELPEELQRRKTRLKAIDKAMKVLEERAKKEAEEKRAEIAAKEEEKEQKRDDDDKPRGGRSPNEPSDKPKDKAQYNFTDPESRIMKDGATKSFEQGYNAQAATDDGHQIIVAADVTQQANDKKQAVPMVDQVEENTGRAPDKASMDSGYFSEANALALEERGVDAYIATERQKHDAPVPSAPRGRIPDNATVKERMQRKLRTVKGRATYARRKATVEPVFGQIKEARGFRRFLLRGLDAVRDEWKLICLTHNILKLFRSGRAFAGR